MMALLGMDAIPAGMELFQASDDDQWSYIKDVIDQCDYYILIVGFRYGSTNADGVSFTELEYDYAVSTGKPIMSLLRASEEGLSAEQIERDVETIEKVRAFREKVSPGRMCKFYDHPMEVGQHVMAAYTRTKKTHPGRGWIPGDQAAGSEMLQRVSLFATMAQACS